MSGRIVRTITKVKDVNKLSDNTANDNDIITDLESNVYLKNGVNNYIKLGLSKDSESLQSEITSLKSENKKIKKRVTELETSNTDLIKRIEALENGDTTE